MNIKIVIIFNLILCILNYYIFWNLIKLKIYLIKLNENLDKTNYNLPLIVKEIPLTIFLTALEIKNFKDDYKLWRSRLIMLEKIITIARFIYRINRQKFV